MPQPVASFEYLKYDLCTEVKVLFIHICTMYILPHSPCVTIVYFKSHSMGFSGIHILVARYFESYRTKTISGYYTK